MAVKIGSARIDENGRAHGGKAGDQTGKEVSTQNWYRHSKGWRVFRAKDGAAAERIARAMQAACDNPHIGYDQYQRNTLYTQAAAVGFDVSRVTADCETDCSALVRVCCAYAGILGLPADFRTPNEPKLLLATGCFDELKGSKYTDDSAYLKRGDILDTCTQGHTVVVLTDGPKCEAAAVTAPAAVALGDRLLRNGDYGEDVRILQQMLSDLGYDLGRWGTDGDFGDCTEIALKAFQRDVGIGADGICGPKTIDALNKALDAKADAEEQAAAPVRGIVRIEGGNCFVRTGPGKANKDIGVAKRGSEWDWQGEVSETGWLLIAYKPDGADVPVNGWVSGVYGKVVAV